MGHSFGGLVTQLMLARGLGKAGVAVNPAPPRGVLGLPLSTVRVAMAGGLSSPANRRKAIMLTPEQFHYAFMNHVSEAEAQPVYDRLPIPGPARTLFQAAFANFNPNAVTKIAFKADRAPLLILGGTIDHVVPASTSRANFKLQKRSPAITAYREYPGRSHYTVGQEGWEAVADFALEWALAPRALDQRD